MSFTVNWLDLREPADLAARDASLLDSAAEYIAQSPAPVVLDLGCGTGATVRAFRDRAPADTRWRLVDRDTDLLREALARCGPQVETVAADLADLARLALADVRLVTASALFDLMPMSWITALADLLAARRIGLYAALTYGGEMHWQPALPGDLPVRDAFNRHQRGDKGLGPAMGPDAGAGLSEAFGRHGYRVATADSPWRLGPEAHHLQGELIDGIAAAAAGAGFAGSADWAQARRAASGSASCTIGHLDVLALPQGISAQSKITSVSSP